MGFSMLQTVFQLKSHQHLLEVARIILILQVLEAQRE